MATEYYFGCPPPGPESAPQIAFSDIMRLVGVILTEPAELFIEADDQVYAISFDHETLMFNVLQFSTYYSIPKCYRDPMDLNGVVSIIKNNNWHSATLDYGEYDVVVYNRRALE